MSQSAGADELTFSWSKPVEELSSDHGGGRLSSSIVGDGPTNSNSPGRNFLMDGGGVNSLVENSEPRGTADTNPITYFYKKC
jgi:hypothetical protein